MERTISSVGVIGLGTMGSGIVEVFAKNGVPVVALELDETALARGRSRLEGSTGRAVSRGKLSQEDADALLGRITYANALTALRDVDLVVEAIPERMELKTPLFSELDGIVSPACVLASNTSSLSVTDIAVATKVPGRVVGMHFFNPAPVQRLVEVVGTVVTDPDVVTAVADLASRLGKTPVVVEDRAGFIANSLLLAYLNSAVRLYEQGRVCREDLDLAMTAGCGYPMGPLALMDLIGLDTCFQVLVTMYDETRDPLHAPAPLLSRMVAAGLLGRKTGRGFYTYDATGREVVADDLTPGQRAAGEGAQAELVDAGGDLVATAVAASDPSRVVGRHERAITPGTGVVELVRTVLTSDDAMAAAAATVEGRPVVRTTDRAGLVVDALVLPYLNDAVRLVEIGYAGADDIDVAMRNGCALPKGPFEMLDELGLPAVLAGLEEIHAETRMPGHAPAPLLRRLVAAGRTTWR